MAPVNAMRNSGREILKKEDILQAVIVADSFNPAFGVLEDDEPPILFPLVNKPVLEYTLEFLQSAGVQQIILFCCTHVNKVKEYIRKSKWSSTDRMTITIIVSEDCMSLGDALRDIYDKRLLVDDFILLTGNVVSNMQLKKIMDLHKERRKKDKYALMTSIYQRITPTSENLGTNAVVVVYNEESNRIMYSQCVGKLSKISIPLEVFLGQDAITVCRDLRECQISICSPDVLSLFADNFDYQTVSDFIKGILENEEILGNTIYLHILNNDYAAHVSSLPLYSSISRDIISRWTYPVVPDLFLKDNKKQYSHLMHNVYRHINVKLAMNYKLLEDVVIGCGSKVAANASITHSVIGTNCEIGSNVILKNVFIWDNVKIHDNCTIETSLLANNVIVQSGAYICNSILPKNVEIGPKCKVKDTVVPAVKSSEDDFDDDGGDSDSDGGEKLHDPWGLAAYPEEAYVSSDYDSDDEDAPDGGCGHLLDDANLFYHEVLDTLLRGIEEKLKCDNLILEINSLKYAYNMTVTEVNIYVTKAVLDITGRSDKCQSSPAELFTQLKMNFVNFMDVFKNYIKTQEAQVDILNAMKECPQKGILTETSLRIFRLQDSHAYLHTTTVEYVVNSDTFSNTIVKLIHFLYDEDLLEEDAISSWYNELDVDDDHERMLKVQVQPLVNWLKDAEEESE